MIAQQVDVILLPPREEKPLIPAVMDAKKAGIPVFLIDRNVDHSLAKPGEDYVTFIGSDFIEEGKRAGDGWSRPSTATPRSSSCRAPPAARPPTTARRASTTASRTIPGMEIVACQSGDFARDKGRQVAETLLQAHPEATAIYCPQ